MTTTPIVLVPGFWLGAWAWDDVAASLRADGHEVTAVTLPGLSSPDEDRGSISFIDQVDAICAVVEAQGQPVVLAVHSGSGMPGYAVTDRIPERIAAMVYVDTAPGHGPMDPEFTDAEKPLPPLEELREQENLDGISDEQIATFYQRAVPQPGSSLSQGVELVNDARLDVPTTVIATAFSPEEYQEGAEEGYPFLAGLREVRDIGWVHLPTSHWPMWSKPQELAGIIAGIADKAS
jgi:pimeloyl-ACP methyl ester carboxylesterase